MNDFVEEMAAASKATTVKELLKEGGRSDIIHIDPRRLVVEQNFNPRDFDTDIRKERIAWLAVSIAEHGVQVPLVIRMHNGEPTVVDGESRLRAARIAVDEHGADIKTVPCVMEPKGTDEAMRLARVVSIYSQNDPLTPLEQSKSVAKIIGWGWTHQQVAKHFGLSTPRIYQLLEVAALPAEIKQEIKEGNISATTAVKAVKEHGAEATTVVKKAAKVAKEKGKKVRVSGLKPEGKTKDPNKAAKDAMKIHAKAVAETLEVLRTLWHKGQIVDQNGKIVVAWAKGDYDKLIKRLGVL